MSTLLINIHDNSILKEAPKDTVVISTFDNHMKKTFKNKFVYFSTYDIFHYPLRHIKQKYKLIYPSRDEIKYINNNFINFSFQLNRWTIKKKYNYKLDQKILFQYLVFWLTIINQHSIKKCFIDEDPHRAFDYIAYLIMRFKKIPCYILANMNFGGYRTFIKPTIDSNLESSLRIKEINKNLVSNIENATVDLKHILIKDKNADNFRKYKKILPSSREIISFFGKFRKLFLWNEYIRPRPIIGLNFPFIKIYLYYSSRIMRAMYILYFNIFSRNYLEVNSQDIVFYSHYFPERTTIPLSDPFGYNILDCIAFLKEVSQRVIYKEHPVTLNLNNSHRNLCHHDFAFMKSLLRTGAILVKNKIKKKHIVATLNGTVGLEMAMKGYKVICFGNPWYGFLPNVHIYENLFSLKEFVNKKIVFKKKDILDYLVSNSNKFSTPFCINNRYIIASPRAEKLKKIF